jgi:hypothetical protein
MLKNLLFFTTLSLGLAMPAMASFGSYQPMASQYQTGDKGRILLAKAPAKGERRKILTGEARYKAAGIKGGKTKIDFDEAQIDGARKTPTGVAITKTRPEHEYDLINLRLSWHPEMIESTTQLETGKGR